MRPEAPGLGRVWIDLALTLAIPPAWLVFPCTFEGRTVLHDVSAQVTTGRGATRAGSGMREPRQASRRRLRRRRPLLHICHGASVSEGRSDCPPADILN